MSSRRLKFLREKLNEAGYDGMIVSKKENIFYLLNVLCDGLLIINNETNYFLTDVKNIDYVNSKLTLDLGVLVLTYQKDFIELKNIFNQDDDIAIEGKDITLQQLDEFKITFKTNFTSTEDIVESLRVIKDENDIKEMQKLSESLSNILEIVRNNIKPGVREVQIYKKIIQLCNNEGIKVLEGSKVASDNNSANKKHKYSNKKIRNGSVVLINIVGQKDMYHSEIARTFYINDMTDEVDKELQNIYDKLYLIHDKALRIIKNKADIKKLQKEFEKDLEDIHWQLEYDIVNGIGLEQIEEPIFHNTEVKQVRENMILVLKPHVYIKDKYGLIIKDIIRVTESNFVFLTHAKRDLRK